MPILLPYQTLYDSSYFLPFMDTYYHRRDNTLFIALHSPHSQQHLHTQQTWLTNLHCNVGFRNYLEHIAPLVVEWTKEEEAKYQV